MMISLASLLAEGAVELAGSTVQAIVRDWASDDDDDDDDNYDDDDDHDDDLVI